MIVDFDEQALLEEGLRAEVRVRLAVASIDLLETPDNGPMWWDDPIAYVVGLRYAEDASRRFGYFEYRFLESDGTVHFLTRDEYTAVYCDISGRSASIRTDLLLHALEAAEERLRAVVRQHFSGYAPELPDSEAGFVSEWLAGRSDYAVNQWQRTAPDRVLAKLERPEAIES